MWQLGIEANTPAEFLAKAKEIVLRHKELDLQANALQNNVAHLEGEQQKLLLVHQQQIYEHAILNSKINGNKSVSFIDVIIMHKCCQSFFFFVLFFHM